MEQPMLECPECGEPAFEPAERDEEGEPLWTEEQQGLGTGCGCLLQVSVDDYDEESPIATVRAQEVEHTDADVRVLAIADTLAWMVDHRELFKGESRGVASWNHAVMDNMETRHSLAAILGLGCGIFGGEFCW